MAFFGPSKIAPSTHRRRELAAIGLGIAITAAAYLWTLFLVNPAFTARIPQGHYSLLTDALLSGQLHFKLEPDPRLLALPNPYLGSQGVPRLHDASLYQGRYYMYFGVTPVVVLLGPWKLLTGTFLGDGPAIVIFAFAGFLIATGLWVAGKRRFFPGLRARWVGLGVLMLGLGNYLFFLIQTAEFYQVPISCAYACLMAALAFVALAVRAENPARQALGLALAALAWGLAIGARPDYLLSLPALALPVIALWWRAGRAGGFGSRDCWRLMACTAAPLALIGAGLAAYNWARFGSIFETGIKYQLASMDERGVVLARLANLPTGLRAYLLPPPHYSLYFPFLSPSSQTLGVLPWAPFALAALGFPLTLLDPKLRRDRVWVLVGGAALLAALLNFTTICSYWFIQDRYAIDFLPAAIGLGLFVTAAAHQAGRSNMPARLAGLVLGVAASFTLIHSVLLGLHSHADSLRPLARALDTPAYAAERLFHAQSGPIEMKVSFPRSISGHSEPIVATADGADLIYIRQPDTRHAQFGFCHRGSSGPVSMPVPIDPDMTHSLIVDLGSLYPPPEHPLFAGWSNDLVEALRRRISVRLDGRTVLQASSVFYPNDPLHTFVGTNPTDDNVPKPVFTGKIIEVRRLGMPLPGNVARTDVTGPVQLTLRFPAFVSMFGEPLASTGRKGAGDLVYVTYLSQNRVRFGHDSAGYGAVETAAVDYDPAAMQTVDIDMGSLHPDQTGLPDGKARFQLRFNGRLLMSIQRPFHPTTPIDVVFGFDAAQSSAAAQSFSGSEFQVARLSAFIPPPPIAPGGPVRLSLKFPSHKTGAREPLLVTGRTGAGDIIYVAYVDPAHVRIGYDHWGVGGPLGPPIAGDYDAPHELVLALEPRVSVRMDGATALDCPAKPYPAGPAEIAAGVNTIGGSSCGPEFTGQIYVAEPAVQGPPP